MGLVSLWKRERHQNSLAFSLCAYSSGKGHLRMYQEGNHLRARKRGFTRNQTVQNLDLGLYSPDCNKINCCHVSESIYGILLWKPMLTNTLYTVFKVGFFLPGFIFLWDDYTMPFHLASSPTSDGMTNDIPQSSIWSQEDTRSSSYASAYQHWHE